MARTPPQSTSNSNVFVQTVRKYLDTATSQLPTLSPLITAVLQSAVIACISNTVAQALHAHKNSATFTSSFSWITLLRFLVLDLLTAPPNFKWQEWLEWRFPARPDDLSVAERERRKRSGTVGVSGRRDRERGLYEGIPLEEGLSEEHDKVPNEDNSGAGQGRSSSQRPPIRSRPSAPSRSTSHISIPRAKFSWGNTLLKFTIDALTIGALGNTLAFLIIMGILKLQSPSTILHNIRHETAGIILNGYKLWPFANIVAHIWIPWEKKIVWFAFFGLCWNVYLSLVAIRI